MELSDRKRPGSKDHDNQTEDNNKKLTLKMVAAEEGRARGSTMPGGSSSAIMIGDDVDPDDVVDHAAVEHGEYYNDDDDDDVNDDDNGDDDDDDDDDDDSDEEGVSLLSPSTRLTSSIQRKDDSGTFHHSTTTWWHSMLHRHWFGGGGDNGNGNNANNNDRSWTLPLGNFDRRGYSSQLVLMDAPSVKLSKFALVTVGCILVVHYYAMLFHDKRDHTYGLREMILYDGNHIALDIIVFFVVGRLYQQSSVDTWSWVGPVLASAIVQSWAATHLSSLQHSITPKEIHCDWGVGMWSLIVAGCILLGFLVGAHALEAVRQGIGAQKMMEVVLMLVVFLVPYMGNSFFHLHHWYYAWLFGMHANLDVWWSRLTMSLLWGVYVNGVAIFGRDPIMTCAVTLYQSQNQQCPYLMEQAITAGEMGDGGSNYTLATMAHDLGNDWQEGGCNATSFDGA